MQYEIPNQYQNAHLIKEGVCQHPFNTKEIVAYLQEAVQHDPVALKRPCEHKKIRTQIHFFERFLTSHGNQIVPDEQLLEDFRKWFEQEGLKRLGRLYSPLTVTAAVDCIRRLFNHYFLSKKLISRNILSRKPFLKYTRFFELTETTRNLIILFEKDGRSIYSQRKFTDDEKSCRVTFTLRVERKARRLSDYNRKIYIDKTLTLLSAVNKAGIETLVRDDLEAFLKSYREKGKESTGICYVEALFSIIGNGIALGILERNPFDGFLMERRKQVSRNDFVMPDVMNKLLNVSSFDWTNHQRVRDQCLTLLTYDTGLRASTVAQLKMSDLTELEDGRYQLLVRGVHLKGEKADKTFYFLFQQTILLLRAWIHVSRQNLKPRCDNLFVSTQGKPLTRTGVRDIVVNCCKLLEIQTAKGKTPSPHILRHTLATLNIEPFGKSLSPRLMQQRLVHMSLQILEKNYIHHNPLAEMKEYKRLLDIDSNKNIFHRISREDFYAILNSLQTAKVSSVKDIKEAYEVSIDRRNNVSAVEQDNLIKEYEALQLLSSFEIDYRVLRDWAMKEGVCHIVRNKEKTCYLYRSESINELCRNYIGCEAALKKYSGGRSSFYKKLRICRKKKIGKKWLILKDDYLLHMITDAKKFTEKRMKFPNRISEYPLDAFWMEQMA